MDGIHVDKVVSSWSEAITYTKLYMYCLSGNFRVRKFWWKRRSQGVLNFHWVLFSLFQGLTIKTYSRLNVLLCLFLSISGRSQTQRKLNPPEKFPIYGTSYSLFISYRILIALLTTSNSFLLAPPILLEIMSSSHSSLPFIYSSV